MHDERGNQTSGPSSETYQKGHVLEAVAEMLYTVPGVEVQKRARLRPPSGGRGAREIDLLITGDVLGYPVQFAVECKNEKGRVGPGKIDAFRGKLELLGIPVQHGIYISPKGFTAAALEAADAVGIRTLVLNGLSPDRLQATLLDAEQSIVFYLAYVKELSWEVPGIAEDDRSKAQFYDERDQPAGKPPDFMWKAWQLDEAIPLVVGEYDVPIALPDGCHVLKDNRKYPVMSIRGKLGVKAFVLRRTGTATDDSLDRQRTILEFPATAGYFAIQGFDSKEEFVAYLEAQGRYDFALHVRLPRIQLDCMFWPLSARVEDFLNEQQRLFNEGKILQLGPYTQEQVEGDNLAAVFEPIRIRGELVYLQAQVSMEHDITETSA